LTVDDVAARLQISKAAVYELTRFRRTPDTPRLPARKIGRSLRFIGSEIDLWMLGLGKHTHLQKRRYIKKAAA
jgi:predicted DNA-binding transcriptional regulator AlpA